MSNHSRPDNNGDIHETPGPSNGFGNGNGNDGDNLSLTAIAAALSRIDERTRNTARDVAGLMKSVEGLKANRGVTKEDLEKYVTQVEFKPIKAMVEKAVWAVVLMVIIAVVGLVIVKANPARGNDTPSRETSR